VANLLGLIQRARNLWAARSLLVGAASTVLDLCIGGTLLWLDAPTRAAAMTGSLSGAAFSYFANRAFAFGDGDRGPGSLVRYVLITVVQSTIHGQFVVWFSAWGLPYVAAKMSADVLVFSVAQLLLLRYVVFPRRKGAVEARPREAPAKAQDLVPPAQP
jgi:putative flippase GtrA